MASKTLHDAKAIVLKNDATIGPDDSTALNALRHADSRHNEGASSSLYPDAPHLVARKLYRLCGSYLK